MQLPDDYNGESYTNDVAMKERMWQEVLDLMALPTWYTAEKRRFHKLTHDISSIVNRMMQYEKHPDERDR